MTVDRSDLECPNCRSPLAPLSRLASQYDGHRHELIYASRCPNGGCATEQVAPADVRRQLEAATSDGAGPLTKLSQRIPTFRHSLDLNSTFNVEITRSQVMLAAIVGLLLTGAVLAVTGLLPASFGNDSSGTAAAYADLTKVSDPTLDTYNEAGSWTIYEYNGQYVVTGKLHGTIVYLTPNGNVTQVPYFYDLRPDARKAILAWSSKHGTNPARYPEPDAPFGSELNNTQTTNWSIFKHNGSYVVAGKINGSVVYLYPNGTYHHTPFFYENKTNAKGAIIIWEAYRDQFPEILPSVEPVTVEEVRSDLEDWNSNESKPDDINSSDWDWEYDDPIDKADPSEQQTSYAVRGEVSDSNGDPVEGATVHLHSTPRTTTTGSNGSYTFRNVTPGDHTLYVEPPANTSLAATKPINITMTETGNLRVHESPDHVTFFATTDGTVSGNSLHLRTHPAQPISARGKGSKMETSLRFDQPLNAKNTTVTLTGLYTASEQTTTVTGRNTSETISIDGNTDTSAGRLFLAGDVATKAVSTSGTYTGTDPTVPIEGNLGPRDARVTLTANVSNEQAQSRGTASLNSRPTHAVLRNTAGGNEVVRTNAVGHTGRYNIAVSWKMQNKYYSYEMEGSVYVRACQDGDCRLIEEITREFGRYKGTPKRTGEITETVRLAQGERIKIKVSSGYGGTTKVKRQVAAELQDSTATATTETISVDGNLPPENARIRLTGKHGVETNYSIPAREVRGDPRTGDTVTKQTALFVAPESGYYEVAIPWKVHAWTANLRGSSVGGQAYLTLKVAGKQVLSKSAYTYAGEEETKQGTYTDRVYLEQGETVKVKLEARNAGSASVTSRSDGVVTKAATGQVTVAVDGGSKQTDALSPGETTTLSLPLEPGRNDIELRTTGGKAVDYEIEYVERTGTRSPEVAVGERTVCSFSGVFNGSETCDIPQSALDSASTATLDISTASGPVSYVFEYQARATPQDATVTINGTSYRYPEDFTGSGPLATAFTSGAVRNVSTLSPGTTDVQVETPPVDGLRPGVVSQLVYMGEAKQTKRPTVVVEAADGTIHEKAVPESVLTGDGKLEASHRMSLPAEWFAAGENVIRVKTPDGSLVRAHVEASGLYSQYRTFNRTQVTS